MENALLVGLSAQMALGRNMEIISNNLANVTTSGFKREAPVFEELMLKVYRDKLVGPAPAFPGQMEENITRYLEGDAVLIDAARRADLSGPPRAGPERPGLRTSRRPF